MRPVIGLTAAISNEGTVSLLGPYADSIEKSGGVAIILPFTTDSEVIDCIVSMCDGFFFTGGADIEPERYGEAKSAECGATEYKRDAFELALLEKAFKTDKPILAVCRGIQLVNVALGATLHQNLSSSIPHVQSEPKFEHSHYVNVIEKTPLFELVGEKRIRVNSFHHQAIKELASGLSVMATADDGTVEAVYLNGERYLRAYQYHPERLYAIDNNAKKIFDDFISACIDNSLRLKERRNKK